MQAAADNCELPRKSSTLLRWTLDLGKTDIVKISSVPETLDLLKSIDTDIAIISIMGPYRSGKSFLLDQLVPHEENVFPFKVGDSVQPETEEVAMVIVPPCASKLKETLIFMDSPGLFAPNRAAIFDSQLLAILNLLSSVVIYNSMNIIDRSAIEKLSYAVETAFAMSYFEKTNDENSISRPHLLWVIQNFHLQLLGQKGEEVSGRRWMEKLLHQVDQSNNGTSAFQKQFTDFFSSLDVKTLPFPVTNVESLRFLSTMASSELDPKYHDAIEELSNHLHQIATPKTIGKLQMTGTSLAMLVEKWTENMNVPISDYRANSADELLGHIMVAEVSRASVTYADRMSKGVIPPMSEAEILQLSDQTISGIVGADASPRYVDAVKKAVLPLLNGYVEVNEEHIKEFLSRLVSKVNSTAIQALVDTIYSKGVGGLSDLNTVEQSHLKSFEDGSTVIQKKHLELHSKAFEDLKDSLNQAKLSAITSANAVLDRYSRLMSERVVYPTTEDHIRQASKEVLQLVLGPDADVRYMKALESDAEKIVTMHIKDNNDYLIRFMKDSLQQFNTSSHKLLEKAIRSEGSRDKDIELVEESQIKAFEDQYADVNSKNPELFAATVNELKFCMGNSRATILREQAERKEKYKAKMTQVVKSPVSETEIIKSSDDIVLEILGGETETSFINAFKNELKPDLGHFVQLNEKNIRKELDKISAQINTTAFEELQSAVRAVGNSGSDIPSDSEYQADDDFDEVQLKHIKTFDKEAATLKSKHPKLHQTSLSKLQNSLLISRAAATGRAHLEKAKRSIIKCSMEEDDKGVNARMDSCFSKAQKTWVEGIQGTKLGKAWPSAIGSSIREAAGEALALTDLSRFAEALSTFKQCAQAAGPNLDACVERAKLKCMNEVGCQESLVSASVSNEVGKCEKASNLKLKHSLALRDAWWQLDSSNGWLNPTELMDEASTSFEQGPCSIRNSTKAFSARDQTLKTLASVSDSRLYAAQGVTRCSLVVTILVGIVSVYTRYFLAEKKAISALSNKVKEWSCYISLTMLSVSLLLCFSLAYLSPFLTGLKSAGNSNDKTIGFEFWMVILLILIEVFLLSKELRNSRSISAQNGAVALHTL